MTDHNDFLEDVDDPSDELGYTEYDWDQLSEEEADLHNEVISMEEDEVLALDLNALTDLQKWAAAQVLLDADNDTGVDIVQGLIFGERKHPAVDYLEIAVEFCYDNVLEDNLENARKILGVIHELAEPDDSIPLEFEAMILFAEGEEAKSMAKYQEVIDDYGDDPEVLLNVASHFGMFGMMERANELVDQAESLAMRENDDDAKELVELIKEFRVHLNAEDEDDSDV